MSKFNIQPIWTPFITSKSGHGWYRVKTIGFTVDFNDNDDDNIDNKANEETEIIHVNYKTNIQTGYHGSVIDTGSSTLSMPHKPSKINEWY